MSMYKVVCKCGHVGRGNYVKIAFPVVAESKKQAAAIGRNIPRVKHHHKDAILDVIKISPEEYFVLEEENYNDPYLKCNNIQEQNQIDLTGRLIPEKKKEQYRKEDEGKIILYKKNTVKKPKRFFKEVAMMEKYRMEAALW